MRHKALLENARGWTPWVRPLTKHYRVSCCDCGLAHDVQFRLIAHGQPVDMRTVTLQVRFHRNKRATAAIRRQRRNAQAQGPRQEDR